MRTVIVGAGAMGSLFGFLLYRAGRTVWLVDSYRELVDHVQRSGLRLEGLSGEQRIKIPITADITEIDGADLIILFVKAYDTAQAMADVRPLIRDKTLVLTLQNGIGNVEIIAESIGKRRTLAGTTAHGATVLGLGYIRHAGTGETIIGSLSNDTADKARLVHDFLEDAGITVQITDDVTGLLWSKLLINVGINALTGITGLPNGGLLEYPESRHLMQQAVREAHQVAMKKGIPLAYEDPEQKVAAVCQATARNISSMLQDLRNHKRTEIDYINGAVVTEGIRCGLSLPVNQALTNLIQAIQAQRLSP